MKGTGITYERSLPLCLSNSRLPRESNPSLRPTPLPRPPRAPLRPPNDRSWTALTRRKITIYITSSGTFGGYIIYTLHSREHKHFLDQRLFLYLYLIFILDLYYKTHSTIGSKLAGLSQRNMNQLQKIKICNAITIVQCFIYIHIFMFNRSAFQSPVDIFSGPEISSSPDIHSCSRQLVSHKWQTQSSYTRAARVKD